MTKVYFTLVPCPQAEWEGDAYLGFVLDLFQNQKTPGFNERFGLAQTEDAADLIIVLEPVSFKTKEYAEVLWSMESIHRWPARVYAINCDDDPLAYLAGVYVAVPGSRFEKGFTIAGGYLFNSPNTFVARAGELSPRTPGQLFSFRGSLSSPLRRRMLQEWSAISAGRLDACFTVIDAWFNHTDEQKRDYVQDILNSKFVLCPRGYGTASHRLFEVMQLGRVPVIIADNWVEPAGPLWAEFSLRVAESEIRSIPKLVAKYEPAFLDMSAKARKAWEEFFAPETKLAWMLHQLDELHMMRSRITMDYRLRWSRRNFCRRNPGTVWDRIRKRFRLPD